MPIHHVDGRDPDGSSVTLRYIDDFIILGRSQEPTHHAFQRAERILGELNLAAYSPHVGRGKAQEGKVSKGLDFLGCHVTPYRVEPSQDARRTFLKKIGKELDTSAHILRSGVKSARDDHKLSFVGVLSRVSRMVRGWTEQYKFCNETDAFRSVDVRIDAMLNRYMRTFFKHYGKRRSNAAVKRRILGVWLAVDCERDPLLPLRSRSESEGPGSM